MSSKTILLGVSIFRCGSERSVHGRPSWELAPYDCESERTKDFTAWCRNVAAECCFNERAGECGVVRFTTQFFVLDKSKSIPIRISEQTAWEAVRTEKLVYVGFPIVYGISGSQEEENEADTDLQTRLVSICQDIVFVASRGRELTPKHLGLGPTVHQATRSKELVQLLHSAGHSISYERSQNG